MLASENSVCEGLSVTKKGEGEKREERGKQQKKIKNEKKGTGQLEKEERRRRK